MNFDRTQSAELMASYLKIQSETGKLVGIPIQKLPTAFATLPLEKDNPDLIFMGFEWEMSAPRVEEDNSGAKFLSSLVKRALATPVKDYINFRPEYHGFEMVSIPATLGFHKRFLMHEFFAKDFHKGLLSGNNNGMHVHISKKSFDRDSLKRFIWFINNLDHRNFVSEIAGRPLGRVIWCKPNPLKPFYAGPGITENLTSTGIRLTEDLVQIISDQDEDPDREIAVNTFTGLPTVELRIFQSPLKLGGLFRNLEFTEAVVKFAKETTDLNMITIKHFKAFVEAKKYRYPHLNRFIKKEKL